MCSEVRHQKAARRRKKIAAKDASSSDSGSDDDDEHLSDEEVEFDDMQMDFDGSSEDDATAAHNGDIGGQVAAFNEEDVEFSDDDGKQIYIGICFC